MGNMVIGKMNDNRNMFNHCVMNGAGWRELHTQDEFGLLKKITNTSKGTKHVPLQHWEGIEMFNDALAANNVAVKNDVGMLSPNLQKFVYTAEVTDSNLPDLSFFLGFISFNDKTRSVQTIAGTVVFCCSNGMYRQTDSSLRQKHLSKVHDGTMAIFNAGIEKFNAYRDDRLNRINREKQIEVDDRMLADLVLQMHKSALFGKDPGFIGKIVSEFTAPVPRHEEFGSKSTLWGFENAMTEQYKTVNPINSMKYAAEFNRIIDPYLVA